MLERKKKWVGHVLRGEGLLKEVIEGRMEGKRPRARPRTGMLDDLLMIWQVNGKKVREKYGQMKRRAEDRHEWGKWVPPTEPAARQNT